MKFGGVIQLNKLAKHFFEISEIAISEKDRVCIQRVTNIYTKVRFCAICSYVQSYFYSKDQVVSQTICPMISRESFAFRLQMSNEYRPLPTVGTE